MWADSQAADFVSTAANQFLIRASGGVGIGTTTPSAAALDVSSGDVRIDNHDLFLTTTSTTNNGSGLGYRTRLPGISGDGPFLYGYNGGALGGVGPTTIALSWDYMGNVWVSNNLSTASLTVRNGVTVTGTMTADSFAGSGAGLTSAGLLQAGVLNVNAVGGVPFSTDYVKVGDLGSFAKLQAGSTIEITFDGRLTAMTMAGTGAAFELRIDDAASTVGWARAILRASQAGNDGGQTSITGIFAGLGTGSHTVNMYVQGVNGGGTGACVAGGNSSTDHVVVKEIK